MHYTTVIGLEIHAELLTASKIFCGCANRFGGEPNTRTCPVCLGLPGTLPMLNQYAVTQAVKAGTVLDCEINGYSAFDRKDYIYPDLPKGYQITQFFYPICGEGRVLDIGIERIHLEEDAGKLLHGDTTTHIDYNRCGVPLIEIVTKPDFRSAQAVCDFVEEVCLRLRYAGVCDARLEEGSLRVDVNISCMPADSQVFGTRAEIKNLNSLRSIRRAIAWEEKRQTDILETGGCVEQETRRFDEQTGKTVSMRSKAEAHDYRYFPEPDIPAIIISAAEIEEIRKDIPSMPEQRRMCYRQWGLTEEQIGLLLTTRAFSDFYAATVNIYPDYKVVANWMIGEVNRNMKALGKAIEELPITPENTACLLMMCRDSEVSQNAAKDILHIMCKTGQNPREIAKEYGLLLRNDPMLMQKTVDEIIAREKDAVGEYKNGNPKITGFLMGQIMRSAKDFDPALCREYLLKALENEKCSDNKEE